MEKILSSMQCLVRTDSHRSHVGTYPLFPLRYEVPNSSTKATSMSANALKPSGSVVPLCNAELVH